MICIEKGEGDEKLIDGKFLSRNGVGIIILQTYTNIKEYKI